MDNKSKINLNPNPNHNPTRTVNSATANAAVHAWAHRPLADGADHCAGSTTYQICL